MKKLAHSLDQRYGRRGSVLLVLGMIWIAQGILVLGFFERQNYLLLSGPQWLSYVRSFGWVSTGAFAIWSAHKAQGRDAWGFLALYVMVAYRIIAYTFGFIDWFWEGSGRDGDPRGIVSALVYTAQAFLIYRIAGWPEPPVEPNKERDR